jgi:carboxymethylenebutenolidase
VDARREANRGPMQQSENQGVARAEFVDTGEGHRAYLAVPAGNGPFPGVLVFQEAFGVDEYIKFETERLAKRGYAAVAPDLFDGRTYSYEDRDSIASRLGGLSDEFMLDHVRRAAEVLQKLSVVKPDALGAIGFCMGGRLAFLTAAAFGERLAAAVSFYGGGIAAEEKRFFDPLLERVPEIRAELLMIYGADDPSIDAREHGRLAEALSANKKQYTLTVYAGAGHGFASRDRKAMYNAHAAERAWEEALAVFERTLKR